ncbi:CMP/dCMP deaminase zinc-binding protein [Hydrogenobacter thermophilus TK-6]|uniref:tRNA-specific adenosine deaminase n=1 Tax=Hydrogenobacter thermophilus (strain DSM 6534 / IAM 12695 / TK-6) TaxID=608538 RepID=D3DH57_HYDTT|nr:nucleoside deaminase [Hydrogenobacter thermophilus]ADO45097.1 CMP/dCMP deaminase zinc-binding protein [Hydrogenobacter thermophilus TK-6]BAI69159.1 tRNA-specific adenosine deaminase [Hydrogenobacter thermophilus TK-6]
MEKFIELCLNLARRAYERGETPVGCVVVKDGKVIAKAHNRVEELKDPTAHAEMLALREASESMGGKYLYGCEIYVSLEPCVMCTYAMILKRVERLIFLAQDYRHGGVMSMYSLLDDMRFHHRVRWEYMPVEEAQKLLRDFFRNLRLRQR